MAITLKLREEEGQLVVSFDNQIVKTTLGQIPAIDRLQADPFTNGQVLIAALGGDEMLKRLADDPDNLILLDCDDKADAFAWEFATLPDRQFLCVKAGMLRVVQKTSEVFKTSDVLTLNFIALAADPLVNQDGSVRDGYRLDLDNEMKAIRETLRSCGKNLEAKRIPPTREELYKALRKGPAILHLSCHGNVVPTEYGPMAMLVLEKNDGSIDAFLGSDLMNTKRGILRMVILSACKTATGTEANLAHALALNGVPMTIGMQGSIDDRLSDDFATALYDSLFQGFTFGEALQQARQNIARSTRDVGLPVGYVSANGWSEAFPIQQGTPSVGGLGKPGESALGGEIQPPRPLLGRNRELHQIAKHFASGGKVITVAGTGGMGKTALAAAFAERFAWMWTRGVSGYSFANEVNAVNFRYALMRALFGGDGAQKGASLSESQQREEILRAAREWNGLWLFDNYESIIQGIQENQPEAESIHRLIADLANGDADMLLTSREQPAGLKNERLFPDGNHALHGLGDEAGMELFFQHSVKAKEDARAHVDFALAVQHAADGHPLAIALLAGEYDVSAVPMQAFLGNWQDELASARRGGLAGHHATFTIAFERSYAHLSKDLQEKLALLSIFPFPFFAHGAIMIWDGSLLLPDGEEEIDAKVNAAHQTLSEFTRRSLLEVDANYMDKTPATYRFQPALRQEAARRLDSALMESQKVGYAAYGAWLANLGYGDIHSDIALNHVVRLSMDAMEKATDTLQGAERLWHIRRLAWLKNVWGETRVAFDLLNSAISETPPDAQTDPESAKVESSLRFELAHIYMTHGNLNRALALLRESLLLADQLGNIRSKASSLHAMSQIFLINGDLDRALEFSQESLQLSEQLSDKREIGARLHQMARIFVERGDLDHALELYQKNVKVLEELGDKDAEAVSLYSMADVYVRRGEFNQALKFYEQSLLLLNKLGDKKNKAKALGNMANALFFSGDLEKAISYYQESLQLLEELDSKEDKEAVLGGIANIYLHKNDWEQAEKLLLEAFEITKAIGKPPAFELVKLGQVSQARGDKETALSRYREGLAIFEKMGMPEAQQVREMIAELEGGAVANDDPLAQVLAQAREASQRGDVQSAIQYQEQAVSLARERESSKSGIENSQTLFVQMVNLAQFYAMAERFDDAIALMNDSLKLGESLNHPELDTVRQMDEAIKRLASMTPEEREQARAPESRGGEQEDGFETQLQAQLAQLPPEKRAEAEAQIRKAYAEFQRMSPEEQARALQIANDQSNRAQIDNAAYKARDAGLAFVRKQAPKRDVLQMLEGTSKQIKAGESAGSAWLEVAALCDALVALIREESIPPVPAAYAGHFSAVQSEIKK
ncbi:MAG: tetratricopeptide repeat protein [Anaerolineae bacterium]|nr:tetratricopeptide repeat protein [Anaerolineae bacterium]